LSINGSLLRARQKDATRANLSHSTNHRCHTQSQPASASSSQIGTEQFYVLENEYQQIVFSTFGGAIAEINLPSTSPTNPTSIVRPINFDKIMLKD
jgi:hypothetical protein